MSLGTAGSVATTSLLSKFMKRLSHICLLSLTGFDCAQPDDDPLPVTPSEVEGCQRHTELQRRVRSCKRWKNIESNLLKSKGKGLHGALRVHWHQTKESPKKNVYDPHCSQHPDNIRDNADWNRVPCVLDADGTEVHSENVECRFGTAIHCGRHDPN